MPPRNSVQLITYPDSLGGNLTTLADVLDEHFPDLFGGIHILPPFPSSGDRGFAPLAYEEIDPAFGSWDDIAALAARYDVALDLMANHISARSPQFLDYLAKGARSEWADLFITLDKVWPSAEPVAGDLEQIFLRRARPWSSFEVGDPPTPTRVWTTFGKADPSEQIDLDPRSRQFRELIEGFFARFAGAGVKIVRLDAVGYLAKRAGTSCFMVEPEMSAILDWLDGLAARHELMLLPEVHARPEIVRGLTRRGSWTYDFVLPYRILEALILRTPTRLADYLAHRPARVFTMIDCHDGIPVKPDLDGLYDPGQVREVVDVCLARGGNPSLIVSPEHQDPDGFDVHQIRGTLYSLLDCDDDAFIAARAIQLFAPGIPQIYYVGLLAGENDQAAVAARVDGREINRHNFSREEIAVAARRIVVERLERLIRLRNSHPAFDGLFEVRLAARDRLRLAWVTGADACTLEVDFQLMRSSIQVSRAGGTVETLEL